MTGYNFAGEKMEEFEKWLRIVCFQKPTPEAYDLAKDAWIESSKQIKDKIIKNDTKYYNGYICIEEDEFKKL
jgi:hypothetical protein